MKEKKKRSLLLLLMLTLMLTLSSVSVEAASYKLNSKSISLQKGSKYRLKVSSRKVKVSSRKARWSSSKKSVAAVTSKGKVTAKKNGTAYITCKVGKKSLKCKVTVFTAKMSKSKVTLKPGKSYTLKVTGAKPVKWVSSDTSLVTVNKSGKVVASKYKNGTAYVYAYVGSAKTKLKCKVTVSGSVAVVPKPTVAPKPIATPTPKPTVAPVKPTATPSPTPKPTTAPVKPTVTPSPTPVPVKPTATPTPVPVKPTVTPNPDPGAVRVESVRLASGVIVKQSYMVGESYSLAPSVVVSPANATDKTVIYESTNTSVATVSESGVITATGAGSCSVMVYSRCNGKTAMMGSWVTDGFVVSVTVVEPYTDINRISFKDADCQRPILDKNVAIGETRAIIPYTVDCPNNGGNGEYYFSSSNSNILAVDQSGNITGKSTGFATITATSKYPNKEGNYVSGSTTYHVGAYDDATIMKYIRRDLVGEKAYMATINAERVKNGLPAFEYSEFSEECSLVRALYNIFTNIQDPDNCDQIMASHGGGQNGAGGVGGVGGTFGEAHGVGYANAILASPGHYTNNMTKSSKYAYDVILEYQDPAGVSFGLMIETFGGLYSDENIIDRDGFCCRNSNLSWDTYCKYLSISRAYPIIAQ